MQVECKITAMNYRQWTCTSQSANFPCGLRSHNDNRDVYSMIVGTLLIHSYGIFHWNFGLCRTLFPALEAFGGSLSSNLTEISQSRRPAPSTAKRKLIANPYMDLVYPIHVLRQYH